LLLNKNSPLNIECSKILHENGDISKNGQNKKGVETSKLANDTKKVYQILVTIPSSRL
jgi:hypothetical protein